MAAAAETSSKATARVPVGWRGWVSHDFPADTDDCHVVNVRLGGFEQSPSSCASGCGCTWRASFPDAEAIAALLRRGTVEALPPAACQDISDRLNRHCRRYVTGGRMSGASTACVLLCVLSVVALQIWNAEAARRHGGDDGDDGGPKWWLFPIVPGVACVVTIFYAVWVICVRNKSVDRAMRDECAALSAQHEYRVAGVSLSFTTFLASIDPKPNPANMLKYVTIRHFIGRGDTETALDADTVGSTLDLALLANEV